MIEKEYDKKSMSIQAMGTTLGFGFTILEGNDSVSSYATTTNGFYEVTVSSTLDLPL